jgi:antitoxin component YwqK of YwqJK toxin-antitoxin module
MKKFLMSLIILTLVSCNYLNQGVEVKIDNNSDETITDIVFTTSENLEIVEFESIDTNKSVKGFLSMKKNKVDGTYLIKFTRKNGKIESKEIGYYSNGIPLEEIIEIKITNDSIK